MSFSKDGVWTFLDSESTFRLIAVGDVIPGGYTEPYFRTLDSAHLLGTLIDLFKKTNLILFNLESPLCSNNTPIHKCGPCHKVDPKCAYGLKSAGFHIASLANNHIFDHGKQGLEETLSALDEAGILRHGAGRSFEEANKPLKVRSADLDITFLSYAEGEFSSTLNGAGAGAACIDLFSNSADIVRAKASSDVVIVSVHAGNEYQHFPSPWIQQLYRSYIDYGADLVIGHHPHIPQGIEIYKNKLIAYSLGDFMFDFLNDPGTCITFALEIRFCGKDISSIHIHPIRKRADRIMDLLQGTEMNLFMDHLNMISEPLGNSDALEKLYIQGILRRFESFYIKKLVKNILLVKSRKKERESAAGFLVNMFDCRSHSEALKTVFSMIHKGMYLKDHRIQEIILRLNRSLEILSGRSIPEFGSQDNKLFKRIIRKARRIIGN